MDNKRKSAVYFKGAISQEVFVFSPDHLCGSCSQEEILDAWNAGDLGPALPISSPLGGEGQLLPSHPGMSRMLGARGMCPSSREWGSACNGIL